ncbi:hypothetical protein ACG33_10180 [Steroidobacter denitrificans]|uniref:TIGR03016 family PEP-CTERM system-associated outer membrane protein n=1 Tax=Steroidobacter denitrificans TaxID=465721 RepID=A0A127FAL2_STEDE|nr:outer membrane beta-barrel protein [Steroidobacter denitrificans]AMN47462.1 hypothetical protein ACG33_10180 [Steroidobacter denitrificans]
MAKSNRHRGRTHWRIGAVAFGLTVGIVQAQAQDTLQAERSRRTIYALDLNAGVDYSDNVTRVLASGDEIEETIGSVGFTLMLDHEGRRVRSNVAADLAWLNYFDNTFDDEVVGYFDGDLTLELVPERIQWVFLESFGQIRTDPLSAETADNREYVNYFTTGPDFTLGLGGANFLRLSGRYSDNTYEDLAFDNTRYSGTLTLGRRLTDTNVLSINVSSDRVEFDKESINTDIDRQAAYLNYSAQGARTGLNASVGYTEVEIQGETSSGLLAELDLTRRLSPSSSVFLSAGTRFSDAGDVFRDALDRRTRFEGQLRDATLTQATDDAFEYRSFGAGYNWQRNRTTLRLGVEWSEERYERATDLDRTVVTWSTLIRRELSRTLSVSLQGRYYQQEYDASGFDDDEIEARLGGLWRLGRRMGLTFNYQYFHRKASNVTSGSTENRVGMTFVYSLGAG